MRFVRSYLFLLLFLAVNISGTIAADFTFTIEWKDVTCKGGSDGSGTVTEITGAKQPVTYTWLDNDLNIIGIDSLKTGLLPDNYFIVIRDGDGTEKGESYTISDGPNILILTPQVTDITCFGYDNGTISASAIVTDRTVEYSIDSGFTYQSSGIFTGLEPGKYHLFVQDSEGCTKKYGSNPLTVTEADPITVTVDGTSGLNLACYGDSDGSIDVTVAGGIPPYSYAWSGPDGFNSTDEDISSLEAGDYYLTVTDNNSCDKLETITVIEPTQIIILIESLSHISCNGLTDGSIDVTVSGGTPKTGPLYDYSWTSDGTFNAATEDISGLSADNYYFEVTDDNSCNVSMGPSAINEPDPLSVVTDSIRSVACNAGNDGAIFVTVNGGTPPYTYDWTGPDGYSSPDEDPSGLFSGDYTLTVIDSRGCTVPHGPVSITQPPAITITVNAGSDLSLLCHGDADGSIDISVSGGTPGYSYSWTGPSGFNASAEDISALLAGNYTLSLTDANDCNQPETVTIDEPTAINIQIDSVNNVSCNGLSNGSVGVTISGGTPMAGPLYVYSWTSDLGYSSGSEDISGLPPDNYYLTVTDDNACTAASGPLTVTEPAALSVTTDSIHNADCFEDNTGAVYVSISGGTLPYIPGWTGPDGFTSSSADITSLFAGDYSLHISDGNGCTYDHGPVAIFEPPKLVVTTDSLRQISCNGSADGAIYITTSGGTPPFTYSWTSTGGYSSAIPDITGLAADNYTLMVTDSKGCVESAGPVTITDPPALIASVITLTSKLSLDCFDDEDGKINISVTGGTPGYIYSWTGPDGFTSSTRDISGLKAGDYDLTVTDTNSCSFSVPAISISQPPLLSVSLISFSDISCYGENNGKILSTTTGGTIPYSFTWTGPDGYLSSDVDSITSLEAGDYHLTVTDAAGCQDSIPSTTIAEPDSIHVTIEPTSRLIIGCSGSKDGRINISVSGGISPYTYAWTGPDGYTSASKNILNLGAGDYNLTITDINLCQKIYSPLAALTEVPAVDLYLDKENVSCNGDQDGKITAHATGGTPPFEYSRNASIWQADSIFTSLSPGGYIIFVRDQNNCQAYDTAVITQPPSLYIGSEMKVDSNNICYGDSNGIIIINAGGGTTPLGFSIDSGFTFNTFNTFTDLAAGEYQTIVKDANGCTVKGNKNVITQPARILISSYSQEDITSCYNAAEGSITIWATGGEGTISYTLDSNLTNIFGDFQNVTGGSHLIEIEDTKGCIKDTTVVISAPPVMIFTLTEVTDVTGCNGDSNGAIYSPAMGGSGSLQYKLDEGSYQDSARWLNLKAGDYTISVIDDNSCVLDTMVSILEPDTIGYSALGVTPITCRGDQDGSITITGSGGNLPYTYTLNPGSVVSATGIFTDLAPDTYTIDIDGSGGCPGYTAGPVIITDPPQLDFDSTETSLINCMGSADGTIKIYITGGVNPVQYSITDGDSYSSQNSFASLPASVYMTLARDANGCIVRGDTIVLTDPPGIQIDVQSATDTLCYGDNSGIITVEASGGTLPLEYTIDSLSWQSSGIFTGLPAGTYWVTIRDNNNCSARTDSITISHLPAIIADITVIQSINGEPGSIHISSWGGTGEHEYSIYGPAGLFQADTAFTGLWPGDYEITVRDDEACMYTEMITLEAIPPLVIAVSYTNNQCYRDSSGTITLSSVNGVGTVEYSIDKGITMGNDSIFEDLPSAIYYIFARDEDHRIYRDTINIAEPPQLLINVDTIMQLSCYGLVDGAIHTQVSGGVQPYVISWKSMGGFSSTDTIISDLAADVYEMTVTDDSMCIVQTGSITITEPSLLTVITDSVDNISCYGFGDGAIYTNISGGTQPYSVLWTGPGNYQSSVTDITGLDTGYYDLVVTDAMGCTKNHGMVSISQPDTLTVSISSSSNLENSCYGDNSGSIYTTADGGTPDYLYYWSGPGEFSSTQKDIINLGGGDYYLLVYDSQACVASSGKITITEPPGIKSTATIQPATCYTSSFDGSITLEIEGGVMPLSYLWSIDSVTRDISGLSAGNYSVTITDADNCSASFIYEVTSLSLVHADAGRDTTVCVGEQLVLNGQGGDFFLWHPETGLNNPNIANPAATISAPVSYLLTVSDAAGCTDTASVNILVNPLFGIDAGDDITAILDRTIQLSASAGPFESYSWSPTTGIDNPEDREPSLTVTGEETYFVTGTSIYGCKETDSVRIFISSGLTIYSGFTPNNGDDINNFWDIDYTEYYPGIIVMVFNRWGKQIFSSEGYSDEQRWDGTYNGKDVPTGTYYYIIDLGDGSPPISGTVTILR